MGARSSDGRATDSNSAGHGFEPRRALQCYIFRVTSPELLAGFEKCPRIAFWRRFKRARLSTAETLQETLYRCLTAKESQDGVSWGQMAGETVLDIASDPGIFTTSHNPYPCAMNHACLADLLITTLRKPGDKAWIRPEPVQNWTPACLMDPEGKTLRRIIIASHWTEERKLFESRNWFTVGEQAFYGLPMQLIVFVVGQERDGRRKSHWTVALKHTIGRTNIRFKRRVGNTSGGFKDSWVEIWREDHDEISRETWLNAMLKDDVMQELIYRIDLPALSEAHAEKIRDLAHVKLEAIEKMKAKPPIQLTGCDWPVRCQFLNCCHGSRESEPGPKFGFVEISPRKQVLQADSCKSNGIQPDLDSPVLGSRAPLPARHSL